MIIDMFSSGYTMSFFRARNNGQRSGAPIMVYLDSNRKCDSLIGRGSVTTRIVRYLVQIRM